MSWFLGHQLSGLCFVGSWSWVLSQYFVFRVLLCKILTLESSLYSCLPMLPCLSLSLVRSVLSEVGLVSVSVIVCLLTCVLISIWSLSALKVVSPPPQTVMSPCLLPILSMSSSCIIVSITISCFIVIVSCSVCIMVSFESPCVIKRIQLSCFLPGVSTSPCLSLLL